jgi:hypothetical protein
MNRPPSFTRGAIANAAQHCGLMGPRTSYLAGIAIVMMLARVTSVAAQEATHAPDSLSKGYIYTPPTELRVTLRSGGSVKILGVGQINFWQSGPSAVVKYETTRSFDDTAAFRQEAEDVWSLYAHSADSAHFVDAVVSANSPPSGSGPFTTSRGYNFIFHRDSTGHWLNVTKPPGAKPDAH